MDRCLIVRLPGAKNAVYALVCAGALLAGTLSAGEARFYFTPERVQMARENIRLHEWAKTVFDSLRREADRAVIVAQRGSQDWIAACTPTRVLNCPVCGSWWDQYIWLWSSDEPEVLVCRRCGARVSPIRYPANDTLYVRDPTGTRRAMPVYRDSTGKAYPVLERLAYQKLMQLGRWLEALGCVYVVTGDERYAQAVRRFLLRLAQVYPTYALHDWYHFGTKPWPQAGKISGWDYEDAVLIVQCGKAYDAVRDSPVWCPGERERVKEGIFRSAADFLTALRPDQGIVNAIPFRYAGVAFAGRILRDAEVMRWVLDDELGVATFIRCHWFPDGTWCERSPSYGLMVLRTFHEAVEALMGYSDPPGYRKPDRVEGFDLRRIRRLRNIYEQPFRILYPDGTLPPFNDSCAGDRPRYLLADAGYSWFRSELSLRNLARALGDSLLRRGNVYSLFHRPPDAPERLRELRQAGRSSVDSSYRSDYLGVVALRGRAFGEPAMLTLQYGGIHGAHDHHDKLDITLFACGREMLSDLGYVYWSHPERFVWMRRSLAHNTVTVDGINQALTGGRLILFDEKEWVRAVEADAPNTYSLITDVFDRQVVWIERDGSLSLVDVFRVRGGKYRDWSAHAETEELRLAAPPLQSVAELEGRDYAYEHLKNVRTATITESVRAEWAWRTRPEARLRLYLLSPLPARLYLADAPAQRKMSEAGRLLPYLIVRHAGSAPSTYVAVWEPFRNSPAVAEVRLRRCAQERDDWPVEVELLYRDGENVFVLTSVEDEPTVSSRIGDQQLRWRGRIGAVRVRDAKIAEAIWFRAYSE